MGAVRRLTHLWPWGTVSAIPQNQTMKATFNDLQDYSSSLDGATVRDRKELFRILDAARGREPFVCQLEGENDWMLTIGIGQDIGFVQHSRIDGDSA